LVLTAGLCAAQELKFADSLLEGRVTSELVSEFSLLAGKKQGILTV